MLPSQWAAPASKLPLSRSSPAGAGSAGGTGSTVTARVAEPDTPVSSVALKVTVKVRAALPGLAKAWLALAPLAVAPSPKLQA